MTPCNVLVYGGGGELSIELALRCPAYSDCSCWVDIWLANSTEQSYRCICGLSIKLGARSKVWIQTQDEHLGIWSFCASPSVEIRIDVQAWPRTTI